MAEFRFYTLRHGRLTTEERLALQSFYEAAYSDGFQHWGTHRYPDAKVTMIVFKKD